MAAKPVSAKAKSNRVFGQPQAAAKMFRVGLYARVSTHDQKPLPLQIRTMREYTAKRGWEIAVQIKEVGSGAVERELREKLMAAARRREIDVVLVWRLDRWGRSLADLVITLKELSELGVGFVSLTEALDLTTPTGRAMAGMLAVFAEFERELIAERTHAGLAAARARGRMGGRPRKMDRATLTMAMAAMADSKAVAAEVAKRLGITTTTLYVYVNGDGSPKAAGQALLDGGPHPAKPPSSPASQAKAA